MKRHCCIILVMVLNCLIPSFSFADFWALDRAHSSVEFSTQHLMISKINGKFNEFYAWVDLDKDVFENSRIEITAQVRSIDTNFENRDKHLQGEEYFDSQKFPVLTFKSTKIHPLGGKRYELVGIATIKGVSKEVGIELVHNGFITDYWGNLRTGLQLKGILNRSEFGLNWNDQLKEGGLIIGEEVNVECNLEVFQQSNGAQLLGERTLSSS